MKHLLTFDLRDPRWVTAQIRVFHTTPPTEPAALMAHPMAAQIKFPRPPANMDAKTAEGAFFLGDGTELPMVMDGDDNEAQAALITQHSDAFNAAWGEDAMADIAGKLMTVSGVIAFSLILSEGDTLRLGKMLAEYMQRVNGGTVGVAAGHAGDDASLADVTRAFEQLGKQPCPDCGKVHGKPAMFANTQPQGEIPEDAEYARVDLIELAEGWMPNEDGGRSLVRVEGVKLMVPVGAQPTWIEGIADEAFVKHSGCTGKYVFATCVLVVARAEGLGYLTLSDYPVFARPEVKPEPRGHTAIPVQVFAALMGREATPDDIPSTDELRHMLDTKRYTAAAPATMQ
jgi:hypothetical protein